MVFVPFSRGELPANIKKRTRFVHFHLLGKIDRTSFTEAVRHFWPVSFVIVWIHEDRGVIVEQESEAAAEKDELESLAKVLESDFYFSVRFYAEDFTSRMSVCENITLVNRRIFCLLKNGCLRCRV